MRFPFFKNTRLYILNIITDINRLSLCDVLVKLLVGVLGCFKDSFS